MSIARTLSRIGIAKNYGGNSRITEVSKACQFGDRYLFDFYKSIEGQTFGTKKKRAKWRAWFIDFNGRHRLIGSALACLEPPVDLIYDVHATPTPHDTTVLVALLKRLERVNNLHCIIPTSFGKISSCGPYAFVRSLSTTGTAKFSS